MELEIPKSTRNTRINEQRNYLGNSFPPLLIDVVFQMRVMIFQ